MIKAYLFIMSDDKSGVVMLENRLQEIVVVRVLLADTRVINNSDYSKPEMAIAISELIAGRKMVN